MPRIRTIKPEFWSDEKLSRLDPITRLVFLGLVSLADDAGRLIDNVKQLDGQLFPNTDDTCKEALETLARLSRVCRYRSASGQQLLQLVNWGSHQRVDKASQYVLPAPALDEPREIVASESRDTRAPILDLGPRTNDQGARSLERASETAVDLGGPMPKGGALAAISAATSEDEYGDVLKFLYSRRSTTRDAWVREMAKLITGTPYTPGDLAGACSDAMALEKPIDGPHALRAFIAKRRDERLKGTASPAGAGPARETGEQRRIAEAKEKRELDRRAVLDREYERDRDAAVKGYAFTDEQQLEVARKVNTIAGTGQFAMLARDSIHKSELAKLAGFPDQETWLAKRERRTA